MPRSLRKNNYYHLFVSLSYAIFTLTQTFCTYSPFLLTVVVIDGGIPPEALRRGGIVSVVRTFQIWSILIGPKLFSGVHMAQESYWNVPEHSRMF